MQIVLEVELHRINWYEIKFDSIFVEIRRSIIFPPKFLLFLSHEWFAINGYIVQEV